MNKQKLYRLGSHIYVVGMVINYALVIVWCACMILYHLDVLPLTWAWVVVFCALAAFATAWLGKLLAIEYE